MYIANYGGTQSAFGVFRAAAAAIQIGTRDAGLKVWGWGNVTKILGPATYQNVWFHMAWTYDGSNNRLYYNGAEAVAPNAGTQQTGMPDQILFSGYNLTAFETFTGNLDDVRFYNRCLSQDEVNTIYLTQSKDCIVSGLISRWVFNEKSTGNQISVAVDLAGNGNNLVPVGGGASPSIYADSIISSKRSIRNCY